MKAKDLTIEQAKWIEANAIIFKVSLRLTPEQLQGVFDIYNYVFSANKPKTSCGRCVDNVKKSVWSHYQKMNIL